jgi:transposase
VRSTRVWKRLLGVEHTVVEQVLFDEDAYAVVAMVRPTRSRRWRCPVCARRCPGYDQGEGRRRWRALDLGVVQAFLEADAPRIACPQHGVMVAAVPWARHGAGFTRALEDTCAWLAVHTSRSAVAELLRVAWRTVGRVCARVAAEQATRVDRFQGLRRIGVDEIAYKRGHHYLTVVVDHDTGRLVWAAPGRDEATLDGFFDALGDARARQLTHLSADAASWVTNVAARRCPQAVVCLDPFHVVKWATDALDQVRREVWNAARRGGETALARELKGARFALWKNPPDLTRRQRAKLARIAEVNRPLYRAYLLKEELRLVFRVKGPHAVALLDAWLSWARRCRIAAFTKLARTVAAHREQIVAALLHGLSNARVESVNTKLRVLTRLAFGFRSPDALIGLAMLSVGGLCPDLPGRAQPDPRIWQ